MRVTGEESEIEAMKEKIRQLESQLAKEKAKGSSQVTGAPPPLVPHSPAHSGLLYSTSTDTYPATQQLQHYATQVQVNTNTGREKLLEFYRVYTHFFKRVCVCVSVSEDKFTALPSLSLFSLSLLSSLSLSPLLSLSLLSLTFLPSSRSRCSLPGQPSSQHTTPHLLPRPPTSTPTGVGRSTLVTSRAVSSLAPCRGVT